MSTFRFYVTLFCYSLFALAAACPSAPSKPLIDVIEDDDAIETVLLTLPAPCANGSTITKYQIQCRVCAADGSAADDDSDDTGDDDSRPLKWTQVTSVAAKSCISEDGSIAVPVPPTALQANMSYCFRVRACNALGWSLFSPPSATYTVPAGTSFVCKHWHVGFP